MRDTGLKPYKTVLVVSLLSIGSASAQFLDDFNATALVLDPRALEGWAFFTGDGSATMDLLQGEGFASIRVDATQDRRNIWWALMKRRVSTDLDLGRLKEPGYELRIEARVRVSHAPRRVNLHLNTQKTVDFHTHLMEFDIPDTTNWHTISMTTRDFEAEPGDTVFGQLALMDWGLGRYHVDVDYLKVDLVNAALAGPDKGVQVPYHPQIPDPGTFTNEVRVAQDCTIDAQNPDVNLNRWYAKDEASRSDLLTVSGTQIVILRWDLRAFAGQKVAGFGLLELATYSVQRTSDPIKDFGMVRIVEILGGDPNWDQKTVTYNGLCQGQSLDTVLNSQMIIDVNVAEGRGSKTLVMISRPVLQRMIDGRTLGLAIRPLGAINASFYTLENTDANSAARLRFNLLED